MAFFTCNEVNTYNHVCMACTSLLVSYALVLLIINLKRKTNTANTKQQERLRLPPGPLALPIVGNLPQLLLSGKPFIHFVRDLLPLYGPIFTVRLGPRTFIVVTSTDLAHEALVAGGSTFASRPPESPSRSLFSCNKLTVNSAPYGPLWRSLRRNLVSSTLSPTRLRLFRPLRRSSALRLVSRLLSLSSSAEPIPILPNARFAIFAILLPMCFGLEFSDEKILAADQLMKRILLVLSPKLHDYLPISSSKASSEALLVRREQIQSLLPIIQRRRTLLQSTPDPSPSFAYVDSLFDLEIEGRTSPPSDEELVTLCSEFLNAGADTTATAIEWAIARLIDRPDQQTRLHHEIQTVAGDREVEEGDLEAMPYLQAFVKELMRLHPPTHLSLAHSAPRPARLAGYHVPAGANLEFYLKPMGEDPRWWSDPTRFDPDRFLASPEVADLSASTGVIKMMPFGAGRRACPGLGMALTHITLLLARMVQEFEWGLHPSHSKLDFKEKVEFTVVMKEPLKALIRPRK